MDNEQFLPLDKATGLSAQPQDPLVFKILDLLSGGTTNPEAWQFGSREENFMRLASILTGILGGQAGLKTITSNVTPNQFTRTIRADPYGLQGGPMDRRVFLDRALGNSTIRGKNALEEKFAHHAHLSDLARADLKAHPQNLTRADRHSAAANAAFTEAADFADSINAVKGWPNAIVNPEAIGTWRDPNYKQGAVGDFADFIRSEYAKRNVPTPVPVAMPKPQAIPPRPPVAAEFAAVGDEVLYNQQVTPDPRDPMVAFYHEMLKRLGGRPR